MTKHRIGSMYFLASWSLLALFLGCSTAWAQCNPVDYGAVSGDNVPDDSAIQYCLDNDTNVVLPGGRYVVAHTLEVQYGGTTFQSADGYVVELQADPSLSGRIFESSNLDSLTLSTLSFNGNKDARDPGPCCVGCDYGKNIMVTGNNFVLASIISEDALCGSGAEVGGSGFEIRNSLFRDNGYGSELGGPWSDGLTVWWCAGGGSIHDNQLYNNTDVNLITGGNGGAGGSCSVVNNTIANTYTHAFAGLMIGQFNSPGDHSAYTFSGNSISSADNFMSFGIMAGFHPWNVANDIVSVGTISGNSVSGAVINLQIEADSSGGVTGQVTSNSLSSPQGSAGYGSCTLSTNYAVYPTHAGVISYDPGYFTLQFDSGTCTP